MTKLTIGKAINAGLRRAMERDPKVVKKAEKALAAERSTEVSGATPKGERAWSTFEASAE